MARYFQITTPEGMSSLTLDSQGSATVQIKVKNVRGAAVDSRAILVSLPITNPPSGAVQNGWVKIDGPAEQRFDKDQEKVIVVKVAIPKKDKPKAGNYQFRLDVASAAVTDEGDSSPVIAFAVAETKQEPSKFPMWLIPVIVVVVIGIGVGVWLALRGGGGPKIPDLVGKTLIDADAELKAAGLTLDTNVPTAESKPEDSGKVVSQQPAAGEKAAKGQTVQVTLGEQMVSVPLLIGHPYQEVLATLNDKHLSPGQTKTATNPNFAGGVVTDQSPAAQQVVKSGTAVDLQVTPQMVTVPNVSGQLLGNAIMSLKGLTVTSFTGDTTKTVIGQSPAAGASVPIGTAASLSFPPPLMGCALVLCRYQGVIAQQMVLQQVMRARDIEKRKLAPQ